jgi:hypothetical protein
MADVLGVEITDLLHVNGKRAAQRSSKRLLSAESGSV